MALFSSIEDRARVESEPYAARDVPATIYQAVTRTQERFGSRPAVSFQLLSDPHSRSCTLTWTELHERVTEAANLFRDLGVGPGDCVAYLLPNCPEAVITLLGGATAGIINPINPLLEAEHIAGILRETRAKVLVTLKAMPKSDVAQKAAAALELAPNVETVLEVVNEALEAADRVKTAFVANMSYELRTPLTVVHGYLDMLDPQEHPDWAPMLTEMQRQSQRMAQLVEDLLTLSRLESDEYPLKRERVDVREPRQVADDRGHGGSATAAGGQHGAGDGRAAHLVRDLARNIRPSHSRWSWRSTVRP